MNNYIISLLLIIIITIKIFIRNWLTQLWSLANPKICRVSKQALLTSLQWMFYYHSDSKGLRTRRASGVVPSWKLAGWRPRNIQCFCSSSKAGKEPVFQFRGRQAGKILSSSEECHLFVLFRFSNDWMRPTHIREDNLLYSVYQFKC